MAKDLAIILNNGSVNSAVATALAAQKYRTVFVHAESSRSPGGRARAAYDLQLANFKPYREHSVPLDAGPTGGPGSPAAQNAPDPRTSTPLAPQLLELLPLVSTGVRFAVQYQASAIYLGLRVGPDGDDLAQAAEYVQIWNEMIQLPCGHPDLELVTPLLELDPWQVVDVGFQVAVPFERTWSCLEEGTDPCWACRGCKSREQAFTQAGKADPLRAVRK